ncbi:hypothetical protein PHYPO_G00082290 [Pangasianodon hypophthalmus]|uniref:Uncharacterized protein n=1 Tax=Pangasianodon hypophthalmus TaxID=310915 RepID=A0A5N5LLN8_PANHP|nr:hypothetical protein PHYPO_G00082290 [Pangasianodon hypophthalmus]
MRTRGRSLLSLRSILSVCGIDLLQKPGSVSCRCWTHPFPLITYLPEVTPQPPSSLFRLLSASPAPTPQLTFPQDL